MSTRTPRIGILGMHIESSAYAAHRAGELDFHVRTGDDLLDRYAFLGQGTPLRSAADWVPLLHARSIPGGAVDARVYDEIKARMLALLREAHDDRPFDGLFLDIHGAMAVDGRDDAEADLLAAIRGIVGRDVMISTAMDLHGNVSEQFFADIDLATCFRLAPHEDAWETRERAAANLVDWLGRDGWPLRARVAVPILLPGEKTSTRVEPAKSLYGRLAGVEQRPGITDASIWIGYAWADEPRCHAAIVVTGDDHEAVQREAELLAAELWRVREDFDFVGPPGSLDEAVSAALAHRRDGGARPYLISDSGDNPGAGGTGDVTWTLDRLLAKPELTGPEAPTTYVASIFDAEAIDALFALTPGDPVDVIAGARVDSRVSGPVRVTGTLESLHDGDIDAGRIAVVRRGGLHIVITERRKAYHATTDFQSIGLDPRSADIIVTKIGYLEPTLYAIAEGWTLALTPGPVDQDLPRLGHHRIRRPMFPFDTFDVDPDLTATVL